MNFWKNGQRLGGHWETVVGTSGKIIGRFRCSCCGECRELATATLARYKYCPNCGAEMDGVQEKARLHACEYKKPDCLCNRCKHDAYSDDCCLYSDGGACPVAECSNFKPEEVPTDGEKA